MRIEARYADKATARLGLRRWRGLYGDPEADHMALEDNDTDRYFRIRFLPDAEPGNRYAVVSFTDREDADAVDADGEVNDAIRP